MTITVNYLKSIVTIQDKLVKNEEMREKLPKQGENEVLSDEERRKQKERANRILDATLELLQRWGYRKTTLDDIARQAGVTKGTLYQHWKTREALFEALLQREYLAFMQDFRQRLANDPTSALLSSLIRHLVSLVINHPLLKAVLQRDTEMLGDLIRSNTGQQLIPMRLETSRFYLEMLRARGMLRTNINIDTQLKMLAAVCTGFLLLDQTLPSELRFLPDELVEAFVETIHLTFEPAEPPAAEVVEEATRDFLQIFAQFIDAIAQHF